MFLSGGFLLLFYFVDLYFNIFIHYFFFCLLYLWHFYLLFLFLYLFLFRFSNYSTDSLYFLALLWLHTLLPRLKYLNKYQMYWCKLLCSRGPQWMNSHDHSWSPDSPSSATTKFELVFFQWNSSTATGWITLVNFDFSHLNQCIRLFCPILWLMTRRLQSGWYSDQP